VDRISPWHLRDWLLAWYYVNSAFRFSGPRDPLAARRVRHGEALVGVKSRSLAAGFSTQISVIFSPSFPLPSSVRPSCLRPRRALPFPAERVFLVGGYDAASEKNALSRLPALLRWPLGCIVSSIITAVGLHSPMTRTKYQAI
jgi:hypothetical protein